MRTHIADASVDLCYIDPPFNSKRNYNQIYNKMGAEDRAQAQAFIDTWIWDTIAEQGLGEILDNEKGRFTSPTIDLIQGFHNILNKGSVFAYLVSMTLRITEIYRILKPTGSFYLHCDPTASHYLKLLMDAVFGPTNFRNDIIWQRTSAHSDARQGAQHFGRVHDIILFYSRSQQLTWNPQYNSHDDRYIKSHYPFTESGTGRPYGVWDITGPGGAAKGNPYYEVFGIAKYWRYSRANMEEKIREGRVI
jgi:adenine specific DNA methylase Mod